MAASGDSTSYVYLFLADLYQYDLGKPELAEKALKEYLKIADDPEVRKRVAEMESASTK